MYYLGKRKITYDDSYRYSIYTETTLAHSASNSIKAAYFSYIKDNFNINDIPERDWKFNSITKSMYEDDTIYKCILEFESLEALKDDYPEYFI
ncbi:MAG: hypothetical protein PVF17_05930 [Ignavibacteria bacterium]|jgi:hypothetical protein